MHNFFPLYRVRMWLKIGVRVEISSWELWNLYSSLLHKHGSLQNHINLLWCFHLLHFLLLFWLDVVVWSHAKNQTHVKWKTDHIKLCLTKGLYVIIKSWICPHHIFIFKQGFIKQQKRSTKVKIPYKRMWWSLASIVTSWFADRDSRGINMPLSFLGLQWLAK